MIETKEIDEVVDEVVAKIDKILLKKDYVVLGFPGGRSIKLITEKLKKETRINWKKIHIFMVDERLVDITHKDSNFKLINDELLDGLTSSGRLPESNVHPFRLSAKKDYGLSDYEAEFVKFGGKFDIAFFGVGEDGHVGGLFPRLSVTNENELFMILHDSPKPPKDRMTLSRRCFLKSDMVVLLFMGEQKKEAYARFKDKNKNYVECPAKLAFESKNSIVYSDF